MQNIKYIIILLACFTTLASNLISQTTSVGKIPVGTTKKEDPKFSRLSLKAGVNLSVIYLSRNVKESNNEPGFSGGVVYKLNNFVRFSGLFTQYKKINIEPTWYNIKAKTYETNLELVARFPNKKTLLYPFVGLSYNTFNGFFTGQADYLNLKEKYGSNTTINNNWVGFNIGTGLEHNFGVLGLFVDYRMRAGKQENAINIMDVCFTGGLKINLPYGNISKKIMHLNDRYYWF